jgi:glutamate N-acetyltransferase/amino-acid N-acetyltransferase
MTWLHFFLQKKAKHPKIKSINDEKLIEFDKSLHSVLLNLAKRIAADGEGSSKFISVNVVNAKNFLDAKKVAFSIANSPLVKTALAGADPNWGRIIMALGKTYININTKKLKIYFGKYLVTKNGTANSRVNDNIISKYLGKDNIKITVDLGLGIKSSRILTCDLSKQYIDINASYKT